MESAIDDGSNYYTLTYTPPNSSTGERPRKIKVDVDRRDVTLNYRRSYLPSGTDHTGFASRPDSSEWQKKARAAMMRGAPEPTEILMKVAVAPMTAAGALDKEAAAGNVPTAATHGPYRRYSVNYAIDPGKLSFMRAGDGKIHSSFDLLVFVFDRDGGLVNSRVEQIQINATQEELRNIVKEGIFRHEEVSVPAHGEYFLRIGVGDERQDHFGAVEVTTSEIDSLPIVH